ncbi:hypothetical protein V5N11_010372 [Cardamine amara subsp. amara]|uniref:Retrotransposon gag domain-containing protein n=1 Tax=Cardamine amara subsp. amara TaxID=228776 RepID=A0ABD0ZII4_CARAN
MTKTRQEERLEELEKNHTTLEKNHETLPKNHEVLSTKMDGLYSKFDDLQATLQQLLLASSQKSMLISISNDCSSASAVKSNATKKQVTPETSHDENLCVLRRVEMPSFSGEDPLGWLARVEQYFSLQQTHETQKVEIAFMNMEGDALHWLQWLHQQIPTLTWIQLKTELTEQFGGDVTASPSEQLAALHQTGSVAEFFIEFLARAAQIPLIDQHNQLGLFLNGLKDEIHVKFRPNDAGELRTAIHVARSIERELDFYYGDKGKPPDSTFRRFKDSGGLGCLGTTLSRTLPYGKGLGAPNHSL